jgi:excisionase family DNA binding protein
MAETTIAPAQQAATKLDAQTYTVEQLAGLLQCSPRHVWRQLDLNKIPGVIRCGRLVRFSRSVIDRWLAGQPESWIDADAARQGASR